MRRFVVAAACAGCSFAPHEAPSDAALGGSDAHVVDSPPPDAMADGGVPAIVAVQSVDPGYQEATSFAVPITTTTGDFLLAATYASAIGPVTVSDSSNLTWTSLPAVSLSDPSDICPDAQVQLWYAVVSIPTTTTVTVAQNGAAALGMHVVEYGGVASASPIDVHDGRIAPSASNAMSTAPLATTSFDAVVALFADVQGAGTMAAGSGWNLRGHDDGFYTLVVDNTPGAAAGTYTPSGFLPTGTTDDCWLATVVALKAR